MNKVRIYYFSGTGNTKVISRELLKRFSNFGLDTSMIAIDEFMKEKNTVEATTHRNIDVIGIGFPIHASSCPNIVLDFVKKLPFARGQKAFVFSTAGANSSANYAGNVQIRKVLKLKGYKVVYDRLFVMGSNFYWSYDERLIKDLYQANLKKCLQMVEEIYEGIPRKTTLNPLSFGIETLLHKLEEDVGAKFFGKKLEAIDACTLCGKCVRLCPKENISILDGKIEFSDQCMMCMRCMYICPEEAIIPKFMKKAKFEEGYDIKRIIEDHENQGNYFETVENPENKNLKKYIDNLDI